jgi:hypothetical protein
MTTPDVRAMVSSKLRSPSKNGDDFSGFCIKRDARDNLFVRCTTFFNGFKSSGLVLTWKKSMVYVRFSVLNDAIGVRFIKPPSVDGIRIPLKMNFKQLDTCIQDQMIKQLYVEAADVIFLIYKRAVSMIRMALLKMCDVSVYRGFAWDVSHSPLVIRFEKACPLVMDPLFRFPCIDVPLLVNKLGSDIWKQMANLGTVDSIDCPFSFNNIVFF